MSEESVLALEDQALSLALDSEAESDRGERFRIRQLLPFVVMTAA